MNAADILKKPKDFTRNGKCSRCGECCSSILPVTQQELTAMRAAADKKNYHPWLPDMADLIYLHCPFLMQLPVGCAIYEDRPAICRTFVCNKSGEENMKAYAKKANKTVKPVNVWTVYGKTGLRFDGIDVTAENASYVELGGADGQNIFRLEVGQPVSILLKDGTFVPYSLALYTGRHMFQIFDAELGETRDILYKNILEIN